jgi:hypothetical protein
MGSFNIDVYDDWLTTDVVGQLVWDAIYRGYYEGR